MSDTTFSSGTTITASWLNNINDAVYQQTSDLTSGVARTLASKLRDYVSVKDFGAVGNGITDDTTAIQLALNEVAGTGGILYFPAGQYKVTSTLTLSYSTTSDSYLKHITILGSGQANTMLLSTVTGTTLSITGGTGEGVNTYIHLEGIRVQQFGSPGSSIGIALNYIAYLSSFDFQLYGFGTGMRAYNTLVCRFEKFYLRGNTTGATIEPNGATQYNPNAITFQDCLISGNSSKGLHITKAGNVNILGGAVEVNGTQADATTGGLFFTNAGAESAVGINIFGVYFEANKGNSDVEITHGSEPCSYNFQGCNFNRTDSSAYTSSNIRVIQTTSSFELNVSGCGFRAFGTYSADASRPTVFVDSSGGTYNVLEEGNYFSNFSTDGPLYNGTETLLNKQSRVAAWCVFNGTTAGTNAPTNGFNVATVQRTAAGAYTVTYNNTLSSNNICPQVLCNASLIPRIVTAGNTSFSFVLEDTAGTDTDASYVSVSIFGR